MLKLLQGSGKMRQCGEDNAKRMVSDIEGVRSLGGREMSRSIRDGICVCVVVVVAVELVVVVALIVAMGVMWGGGVDGSGVNSGAGDGGESGVYRSGEGGGSVVHRSVGGGLCRSG